MSITWLKNRFIDLKYFSWVIKHWSLFKKYKSHLIFFILFWLFYPFPQIFLGRKKAHQIFSKFISHFKEKNIFLPLPIDGEKPYWIGIRDSVDFDIFRDVCIEDSYNRSLLKPGMVVVDVGAHIGTFSLIASKIIGEGGKIIAFEPEIRDFKQLKKNLNLNKINNCIAIRCALSDHDGKEMFFINEKSCAHSLIASDSTVGRDSVMVRRLDNILKEININKVDF